MENQKLITAKEARELVTLGELNIQRLLSVICDTVRKKASVGQTNIDLQRELYGYPEFVVQQVSYRPAEYTPLQLILKKKLEELGFVVTCPFVSVNVLTHNDDPLEDGVRTEKEPHIMVSW